jgi:preprotein translocase subunit SecE
VAKSKAGSKKRRNFITRYLRESSIELRKVNWPTRKEATRLTMIVMVVVVVMSSFLAVLDFLFARFFGFIFSLG